MRTLENIKYPICITSARQQLDMFWLPEEFTMSKDLKDYKSSKTALKSVLNDILSYFVQSDIEISETYGKLYPIFFNVEGNPEIQMLFSTIANMEVIHVFAYDFLFKSLNLDGKVYRNFNFYEDVSGRLLTIQNLKEEINHKSKTRSNLLTIIKLVLFGEGVMLYGMFALLMCLSLEGQFMDMASIVSLSIRDENLHVETMSKFIRDYATKELNIDVSIYEHLLKEAGNHFFGLEMDWISLLRSSVNKNDLPDCFNDTLNKLELYYRYLIDNRISFFLNGSYTQVECPLPFMVKMTEYKSYDFLKTRPTEYTKIKLKPEVYDF
ncbi:MAG: ribonucleotide-diphosphate reductase subunit beta [Paraclostridium sp.]